MKRGISSCRAVSCLALAVLIGSVHAMPRSTAVEAYLAGDYPRARILWAELADGGDAVARFNLGMLYQQGLGAPREAVRAEQYIRQAAAAGYAPAQYQLAMLGLGSGSDGVPDAVESARFWLTRAARQGHPIAALQLGRMFAGEFGEMTNVEQALLWLKSAEKAGIAAASARIEIIEAALPGSEADDDGDATLPARLSEGRGTLEQRRAFFEGQKAFIKQDYARTVEIWGPLAEAGLARAQYGVAFMLESGWGVIQDYEEAAYWYRLAAQKGHRKAQFNLGKMYLEGRGTGRDRGTGLFWIQTAADLGEPRAREFMATVK